MKAWPIPVINYNCLELESILIGKVWLCLVATKILSKSTNRHHYVENEEFVGLWKKKMPVCNSEKLLYFPFSILLTWPLALLANAFLFRIHNAFRSNEQSNKLKPIYFQSILSHSFLPSNSSFVLVSFSFGINILLSSAAFVPFFSVGSS